MFSIINTVMIVFITTFSGETGHILFKYKSFSACESEKELVIKRLQIISDLKENDWDKLQEISAFCLKSPVLTEI